MLRPPAGVWQVAVVQVRSVVAGSSSAPSAPDRTRPAGAADRLAWASVWKLVGKSMNSRAAGLKVGSLMPPLRSKICGQKQTCRAVRAHTWPAEQAESRVVVCLQPEQGVLAQRTHEQPASRLRAAWALAPPLRFTRTVCSPAAMAAHVGAHSFSANIADGGAVAGETAAAAESLAACMTSLGRLLPAATDMLALWAARAGRAAFCWKVAHWVATIMSLNAVDCKV